MFVPPAVAGDTVFVASCSGSLFALNRSDGEFVWAFDARENGGRPEFHGTAVVTEDSIVIATDDRRGDATGHVYAVDRATGKPRWKRAFEAGVMTDLARVGETLYFATLREHVVALDLSDGEPRWTFDAKSAVERFFATSTPLVLDDRLFFGGIDGMLYALDRRNGEAQWKRSLGDRVSTALLESDGKLLAGTADNKVHLIEKRTGNIVKTLDLGGLPFGRPAIAADRAIVFTTGGRVLSLTPDLEAVLWESKVDTEWAGFRPIIVGSEILAGGDDGKLYAISAGDGRIVWSQEFDGPVTALSRVEGPPGELYVGTSSGTVFATRFADPD